jgi:hypothetical protein
MNQQAAHNQPTNTTALRRGVQRYGFQGQEEDQELREGAVSYKYRVEDARLGRFFSVDPLFRDFPYNSCYVFSENRLIDSYELEGRELMSGVAYVCSKINTNEKAVRVADNLGIEGTTRNVFMTYSGAASNFVPEPSRLFEGLKSFVEPSSTKFTATALFGPMGYAYMQSTEFVRGKLAQIESISKGGDEGYFNLGQLGSEVVGGLAVTGRIGIGLNSARKSTIAISSQGNLGNPFKRYTLKEIENGFEQRVLDGSFELKFVNPVSASRAYKNLKSGYSYNLDTGISGKTGNRIEAPHVDVNYPNPKPSNVEPKRKFETKSE